MLTEAAGGERSATYTIQLEIFEGPLDLLLHLVRQQEIDIQQIPLAEITDQYLRYLEMMKDLSITIAGEFLAMAANLIYIKSQTLLPTESNPEVHEEVERFRRDLVQQLVEHEKFKQAAQVLFERQTLEQSVWTRGEDEFEEEEQGLVSANVFDLLSAFHKMAERYKEEIILEIEHDPITVEEKIGEIRRLLNIQGEVFFSLFFQRKLTRLHLAVTFFALLELTRLREVRLVQKGMFEDICIQAC